MAFGLAVLGYVFLVFVGGGEGSGSAEKLVGEICFVFGDLGKRY